jgi:catechol-2,3-dioxygenase
VGIGHVHLKVADLDRALAFYRDVLGFGLTQRYGHRAAFLSTGGYHHIGLNTWESQASSSASQRDGPISFGNCLPELPNGQSKISMEAFAIAMSSRHVRERFTVALLK